MTDAAVPDILADLDWRGLYGDCTDRAALSARLAAGPITLYCGFDPTADSLHVGNLVPLLALRRFQLAGHRPIALAGGATGMIGDPSGKSDERSLLTPEQLAHHLACITPQLERFLDFTTPVNPARVVNNYDWTAPVSLLAFLRDIGKHVSVSSMIAKESVKTRMDGRGISFTEFSYMLLQGFDFMHLRRHFDCELQVGATDQWGNITIGTELTRKTLGATVWGLVFPLLTRADGAKYGKTATGTVWLDAKKTSPYRFYQFFVNADDADVLSLLRTLTFLPRESIAALEAEIQRQPEARAPQAALAREMTTLVHGAAAYASAARASAILFGGSVQDVDAATFADVVAEVPACDLARARLEGDGVPLVELAALAGLAASRGEARRDLAAGGLYLNNVRATDVNGRATVHDLLFGTYLLLRRGKRSYAVVRAPRA